MIFPANGYRIFMATAPVDFRKGMDGLAAYVTNQFDLDPYSGAGLPPLKWSSAMFRKTEEIHGQQATKARRDCHEVTTG